jgi:hypothetical protein
MGTPLELGLAPPVIRCILFTIVDREREGTDPDAIDGPLPDVKACASLATEDRQAIAFAAPARGSVPDLQRDAMAIGRAAVGEEDLAAGRVGLREEYLMSRHLDSALLRRPADSPSFRGHSKKGSLVPGRPQRDAGLLLV